MDESKFVPFYQEIANQLDKIVPGEWYEIVMYAEELGNVRSAQFYYKKDREGEYISSGKIPDDYGVDEKFFLN